MPSSEPSNPYMARIGISPILIVGIIVMSKMTLLLKSPCYKIIFGAS